MFIPHYIVLVEKEMATHSSILAWEAPWSEESGGLQSMGLQRVGHDWVTKRHPCIKCFFHYVTCLFNVIIFSLWISLRFLFSQIIYFSVALEVFQSSMMFVQV